VFRPGCSDTSIDGGPHYAQPSVGHTVARQLVGDQDPWHGPQPPQQLTKEPGGGLRVTPRGDQDVQYDTVLVNGPPQVVVLPWILMNTSSRCHLPPGRGRRQRSPFAKVCPNLRHHPRIVS
jgi:hypothetical protein